MKHSPRSIRFPSVAFSSREEFEAYRQANKSMIDGRHLHETNLASGGTPIRRQGACAVCVRPAVFASQVASHQQGDAPATPDWPEEQACDCEDRLTQRSRALLHFAEASQSLHDWTRLLLFGRPGPADRRLTATARQTISIARLQMAAGDDKARPRYRIAAGGSCFHTVISADYLQHVPPLAAALQEIRRVLVLGGRCILTVPLRILSEATETTHPQPNGTRALPAEVDVEVHRFGWDILDSLLEAGFEDPQVHMYWSDELGYLGPFKTIVTAIA